MASPVSADSSTIRLPAERRRQSPGTTSPADRCSSSSARMSVITRVGVSPRRSTSTVDETLEGINCTSREARDSWVKPSRTYEHDDAVGGISDCSGDRGRQYEDERDRREELPQRECRPGQSTGHRGLGTRGYRDRLHATEGCAPEFGIGRCPTRVGRRAARAVSERQGPGNALSPRRRNSPIRAGDSPLPRGHGCRRRASPLLRWRR